MEYRKILLYFAVLFVAFSLWTAWLHDHAPAVSPNKTEVSPQSAVPSTAGMTNAPANIAPVAAETSAAQAVPQDGAAGLTPVPPERLINVRTDVLDVTIDTLGGNIVNVKLPNYPNDIKTPKDPVTLLTSDPNGYYVAQSGITGRQGPDTAAGQVQYKTSQNNYTLVDGENEVAVNLTWQNKNGIDVTKTFRFTRDNYAIHVDYAIQNKSDKPWAGNIYGQIRRKPPIQPGGLFHISNYIGASISSPEKPYQKISFSHMEKEGVNENILGGWLAMQQRYFLSAWVPNQQQNNHYYSNVDSNGIYTVGFIGPSITVPPKGDFKTTTSFYAGPELENQLKAVAPNLDLTIDYGWLWWISVIIFWVMERIHRVVGNWGWSIVLVTVLIKILFYKFSEISYRSMAKMRLLQPKMEALKQRYGDDKAKLSQATMELYRKEKINPLGGCLPIIVQIPVFIALYYVLIESVQLRQAPFIFWIHDLSAHDPYFVLPILMGISMFVQQKLNPTPPDPVQARVMQLLPVMFTIFFFTFPSGLVLYWLTNNVLSILQQWHITRNIEKKIEVTIEKKILHRDKK